VFRTLVSGVVQPPGATAIPFLSGRRLRKPGQNATWKEWRV
jgi:hypothetical protein